MLGKLFEEMKQSENALECFKWCQKIATPPETAVERYKDLIAATQKTVEKEKIEAESLKTSKVKIPKEILLRQIFRGSVSAI